MAKQKVKYLYCYDLLKLFHLEVMRITSENVIQIGS